MLQLEPVIVERLAAALAGWEVKGDFGSPGARQPGAAAGLAVVSLAGSAAPTVRNTGVLVSPGWAVVLVARKGPTAPQQLDDGVQAVIGALHHWMPGAVGGRPWEPLALAQVSVPPLQDDGLAGVELTFTTSALYRGQN